MKSKGILSFFLRCPGAFGLATQHQELFGGSETLGPSLSEAFWDWDLVKGNGFSLTNEILIPFNQWK